MKSLIIVFLVAFIGMFSWAQSNVNFNMNIRNEPATLNPITATDMASRYVHRWVLDRLLQRDIETYEWKSGLAESWSSSKDGRSYTFKIRKDSFFHDGQPVTAEDVKFSLDILKDPNSEAGHSAALFDGIAEAIVVDTHTITFKTKEIYFQNFEVLGNLEVIPKHIYKNWSRGKKLNKEVIGSGPYFLSSYDKGKRIVLKKFDRWYGPKVEHLKSQYNFPTITMRFVKEENVAFEMLKNGELDFDQLSPEQFEVKAKGDPWGKSVMAFEVENLFPKPYSFIAFNQKNELFKDKEIRQALTFLFNRQEMIKKFQFNKVVSALGPIHYSSEFVSPKVIATAFDPAKATALLAKNGWSDRDKNGILEKDIDGSKKEFRFSLLYSNKDFEKYYTFYQEDLRKAGIVLELKILEWGAFSKAIDDFKFEALGMSWRPSNEWDPKPVWHSSSSKAGGSNFISYSNPTVDSLIDKARSELDRPNRIRTLQKIHELIAQDYPYIFMFNRKYDYYAVSSRIIRPKDTFRYEIGVSYWK